MMKTLLVLAVLLQTCIQTSGLFSSPVGSILTTVSRNISCLNLMLADYNGTAIYNFTMGTVTFNGTTSTLDYSNGADYCVLYQVSQMISGVLVSQTTWRMIATINEYRNTAISRCGFSSSMDIGYNNCTNRPFEDATTRTFLCICSTNHCSDNMTSCRNSVDQTRSSSPPLLPVVIPILNNSINCNQTTISPLTATFWCGIGVIPNTQGASSFNASACNAYLATHTFMCMMTTTPTLGTTSMALIDGAYEIYLKRAAMIGAVVNFTTNIQYYEGSTNLMITMPPTSGNIIISYTVNGVPTTMNITGQGFTQECFCTTNNCDRNYNTCAAGLNYSSSSTTISSNTTISSSTTVLSNGTRSSSTTVSSTSTTVPQTSNGSPIKCFSSDSRVMMFDGTYKSITTINTNDLVATPTKSRIVLILDSHRSELVLFHTIKTESNKSISLTGYHLIATTPSDTDTFHINYKLAKDVRIGNFLVTEKLFPERVVSISIEAKNGYYAPMSESGTLIVNGLMASCYANVLSHRLAHWAMTPVRLHYRFLVALRLERSLHQESGIHPIADLMMGRMEGFLIK